MEKRVLELLEQLVKDVQELKQGQEKADSRLARLEQGQTKLEQGQTKLEQGQTNADSRLERLEQGQIALQSQVSENTQILKALEHAAQVNKAEHDVMLNEIAHIKGDIVGIKKDLNLFEIVTARNWSDIIGLKAVK